MARLAVANVRIHDTLGERVADQFDRERPCLGPMAPWPYRPVVPQPEPWTRQAGAPSTPRVVDVERAVAPNGGTVRPRDSAEPIGLRRVNF